MSLPVSMASASTNAGSTTTLRDGAIGPAKRLAVGVILPTSESNQGPYGATIDTKGTQPNQQCEPLALSPRGE